MTSPQEHVTHGPTSGNGILKSVVIHPGEYMLQFLGREHGVVRYLVVMTQEHLAWREIDTFASPWVLLQRYVASSPQVFSAVPWQSVRCMETSTRNLGYTKTVRFHLAASDGQNHVVEFEDIYLSRWIDACRSRGLTVIDPEAVNTPAWKRGVRHNGLFIGKVVAWLLAILSGVPLGLLGLGKYWLVVMAVVVNLNMAMWIFAMTRSDSSSDNNKAKCRRNMS